MRSLGLQRASRVTVAVVVVAVAVAAVAVVVSVAVVGRLQERQRAYMHRSGRGARQGPCVRFWATQDVLDTGSLGLSIDDRALNSCKGVQCMSF